MPRLTSGYLHGRGSEPENWFGNASQRRFCQRMLHPGENPCEPLPSQQCQLKLCHSAAEVRIVAAFAHLLGHISANLVWIASGRYVLLVSYEKFSGWSFSSISTPSSYKPLIGALQAKKSCGTWTEGDHQTLQTEDNAAARNVLNHLSYVLCIAYRILRDVTLQVARTGARAVEHTAVSTSPRPLIMSPSPSAAATNMQGPSKFFAIKKSQEISGPSTEEYNQSVAALLFHFAKALSISYSSETVHIRQLKTVPLYLFTMFSRHSSKARLENSHG